jgi:hypothetical protein
MEPITMRNDVKQGQNGADPAPSTPDRPVNERLRARIESHVERDGVFGCWLWTGKPDRYGYGTVWLGGPRQAHRVAYVELVGPVAPGLKLDHLCRRRHCVRPDHLEPVTEAENQLRANPEYLARRTRCRNGHPLDRPIRTPEGGLLCRRCQGPERPTVEAFTQEMADGLARAAGIQPRRLEWREPRLDHPLAAPPERDQEDDEP